MKNINWGADFNLLYARYYSKYTVDGKEYNQTLNEFKYSNIINPNNSISIGNTCSSSVTFSIFQPEITLENKDITIFEGVKGDSGIEYVQIGIFTAAKEESNGEYTKYTAYDKMYKAEKGYFSELTYPSTDKAILEEICTKLGIQLATSITNTHTIIDKPQGYTMREMIGYMAMLQGGNAAINSDGNLEIKWYKDSGYVLDGHQYYQQGVTFTTSKDFTIRKLTCNNTKSGDKETSTITSGSGTTGLSFANPFMTQANLNEIYKKIGGFQFRPLTVKFVGDWRLEVGDIITVNKGGIDYKVPIMQITHECDGGLMDTVTSIGQSDTENSNIASGPITKQMERYYADLVLINKAVIENADITSANIESLKAHQAYIDQLKANKIETITANIVNLTANKATINEANIAKLQADYAQIGVLNADVADIKTLMFGSATGKSLTTEFANAVVSVIGNAQIKSAMIDSIAADKITSGKIYTNLVEILSESGNLDIADNTIQIKDDNKVARVQIGKDANSDYNMYVWDKAGNLMFDALGLTEKGVTRKVVRDDVVQDNANINASKLDIETLFSVINNDNTHTLKSNKIYLDNEGQTLNVIMQAITSGAGKDYTQWGGMMKVASDFITNKLWWTENVDNESIKTKFSTVNQKLDSYEITLSDLYQQTNDNFMVYTVTETPNKDNYPAIDWFIPIYPSDDLFPSDNLTWTYSNDEYAKYHGAIAYNETAHKTWRWAKDGKGNWGWKEVSNTQLAYMLNQNASLKINLKSISTELTQTKKNLTDNYSTTTTMINKITQEINDNGSSISLALSGTYAKSSDLESYATKTSLDLYIKKDPKTGELKSAIEAIADTINITARGGLNLSGNRFTLNSTNASITADGTITCSNLIANGGNVGGWKVSKDSISTIFKQNNDLFRIALQIPGDITPYVFSVFHGTEDEGYSKSPNFYISQTGKLYATNAQITGSGYFSSGTIGGWDISKSSIYKDYGKYRTYIQAPANSEAWTFSCQEERDGAYYGNWYVRADGYMYASKGQIGNFSIDNGILSTYQNNGIKGMSIDQNYIKFYSWVDDYENYVGSITTTRYYTSNNEVRRALVLNADYGDVVGINCTKNKTENTEYEFIIRINDDLNKSLEFFSPNISMNGGYQDNIKKPTTLTVYCYNPNSGKDTQNVRITNTEDRHYENCELSVYGSTYIGYDLRCFGSIYGTIASDSDENVKKDVHLLNSEESSEFIYNLKPCEFKMINGTSNRYHHGFIAQQVKETMKDDWGLFIDKKINNDNYETQVSDENGNTTKELTARYALRYDELIADIVATVQSQNMRIKKLEKQLSN
ncbi:tail fiber domain-containing protein [Pseudoruminococcus massiliensis]|uniref:tail fiber domain-containing protein n=1 Tax=Pseudoruminococcus massiliensis TaxID=2086583 RepID=UPI003FD74DED